MKVALANGLIGLVGSFGVGLYLLGMSGADIALCAFASTIAALISVISTLRAVKWFPSTKKPNSRLVRAWIILGFIYLAILFLIAPPMRNSQTFLYLIFPLILTSGFSILIFGPIQDYLVSAEQKKRR
jgi:integral membrane sensor domain MASE1